MSARGSESRTRPRSSRVANAGPERARDAWGFAFCGGASARMGRDKARLELDGTSLIARAVAVLGEVVPRVLLASGAAPRYPELGLECVLDEGAPETGAGPLAGLAGALARIGREAAAGPEHAPRYAVVLACDMPRVRPEDLRSLLARARASDADVCLPAAASGPEPLCAVVHARCLAAVRAALARGERRLIAFHPGLRVVAVPTAELGPGCTANLNTPAEYRAAMAEAPAGGGGAA